MRRCDKYSSPITGNPSGGETSNLCAPHPILSNGLKAFVEQQAAQENDIAKDWLVKWRAVQVCAQLIIDSVLHVN